MGLDSNKDLEIKKKVWENLAHSLTELTVQNIAAIMNKTASLSRVDMSGSCTWCSDLVTKRRYVSFFDVKDDSVTGYLAAFGISTFFLTYDVQLYINRITAFSVPATGNESLARETKNTISYTSRLMLLKNGELIDQHYFEVDPKRLRVVKKDTEFNHRYVGEVDFELPDPNSLTDSDQLEILLITTISGGASEGAGGLLTSKIKMEIQHEEVVYSEGN